MHSSATSQYSLAAIYQLVTKPAGPPQGKSLFRYDYVRQWKSNVAECVTGSLGDEILGCHRVAAPCCTQDYATLRYFGFARRTHGRNGAENISL